MKIAILTLPLNNNFGGILQAYALRQALLMRGHNVYHVEEKKMQSAVHLSPFRLYSWWYTRRLLRQILTLNRNQRRKKEDRDRYDLWHNTVLLRAFVANHVPIKVVESFDNLRNERLNGIVVGSDQIWRLGYYRSIEDSFLSFATGWPIKRIAYAPSFGVTDWEFTDEQTTRFGTLLHQFDAVSVREDEAVTMCREKFDIEAVRLLDPTLLLQKTIYEGLIGKEEIKTKENQLTTYILDMDVEKQSIIRDLVVVHDMHCVKLSLTEHDETTVDKHVSKCSIESWLKEFMQAEFVFTDSFHGCVFAILFHKPFLVCGNKSRGLSRFNSLLRLFRLEERMVFSADQIKDAYNQKIDWSKVDSILEKERERASSFFDRVGL